MNTGSTARLSAQNAGRITIDNLTVNRLGYGAMRITGDGTWGPPAHPEQCIALLRRAVELDINFIDTADSYGPNVSEELIAEALWPYPPDLVITTKAGWRRLSPYVNVHNASPQHLRSAIEGSLRRLKLECIDLYQLHIPDHEVSFEVTIETLAAFQAEGKVRHIGLCNVTREHVERARKIVPIVAVQNRYNMADREWDSLLEYCLQNGIAFIPWAPIRVVPQTRTVLDRVSKAHGVSDTAVALAWLLQRAPNTLLIPGTTSTAHLEDNIRSLSLHLSAEEFKQLSDVDARPARWR